MPEKPAAKTTMKVEELIQRKLITADVADTYATIEERMADLGIHALPVVDELGTAIGIVTSSDLDPDTPGDTPVSDFMSDQIFAVSRSDDAREAARLMRDHGTHHLVVTDTDRAVGIISSFDLLLVILEGA